jgi:putative chitinase
MRLHEFVTSADVKDMVAKATAGFDDISNRVKSAFSQHTTSGDTPVLSVPAGRRGPAWADLQKALVALGYKLPRHGVDGISGPETSAAIRNFEADNKLTQDGSVDDDMIQLMNKILRDKKIKFKKSTEADVRPGGLLGRFKGQGKPLAADQLGDMSTLKREAQRQGIKGKELAAFLAQCSHESGGGRYMSEIWGNTPAQLSYQGRMGNVHPGDGYRYRGRGYIGLTGRNNYRDAGRELGLPLEQNPDIAERPDIAAKTAAWFWQKYVQPKISNWDDVASITRIVNGGYNGLNDREARYAAYTQQMTTA